MYDMATIIPAVLFGIVAVILFIWCPLSKKRVKELQVEKEEILRLHYEAGEIGIQGHKITGDIGISDAPEFRDDIGVEMVATPVDGSDSDEKDDAVNVATNADDEEK